MHPLIRYHQEEGEREWKRLHTRPRPLYIRPLQAVCGQCDTLIEIDGRFPGELAELTCEYCGEYGALVSA